MPCGEGVGLHSSVSTIYCPIFLPSSAKGSSLVLGAGHLEGLRLFGANVQVGSIFRAPGPSSQGGVDGRCHTAPCGQCAHSL